ncbi:MAG: helix-turn-helix domain-containing protein, partial [Bacteroidetes bacterium]|nr:helix-turn-helix domain-containing protein [Bacteroidota bacterium]
ATNNELKNKRLKLKLSIEDVSTYTKVRVPFINAIEENQQIDLPTPYINSFKKTLDDFYTSALKDSTILKELKTEKLEKNNITKQANSDIKQDEESNNITSEIIIDDTNNDIIEGNEGFTVVDNIGNPINKKYSKNHKIIDEDNHIDTISEINIINDKTNKLTVNKSLNNSSNIKHEYVKHNQQEQNNNKLTTISKENTPLNVIEVDTQNNVHSSTKAYNKLINKKVQIAITYTIMVLLLVLTVYFIFFYGKNDNYDNIEIYSIDSNKITKEDDNLLVLGGMSQDSIVFEAHCIDTAWIKVDIDGKKYEDLIMTHNEVRRWSAAEYILLSTSNVGNIKFYKNDTLLPNLGAPGSMIKNIRITAEGISNVRPLENGTDAVSINDINTDYNKINPSKPDTNSSNTDTKVKTKKTKTKKSKEEPFIPILDFSTPEITKSPVLEEKKEKE